MNKPNLFTTKTKEYENEIDSICGNCSANSGSGL